MPIDFKTTLRAICLALFSFGFSSTGQAQSSEFDRAFNPYGAEARVSFSIPFGDSPDRTKTKPRLDFAVRHYANSSQTSIDWMMVNQAPYRETRLGLTLEQSPQVMLNNQVLSLRLQDEQANLDGLSTIILTVAGGVVIIGGAYLIALATCDEPCFEDE